MVFGRTNKKLEKQLEELSLQAAQREQARQLQDAELREQMRVRDEEHQREAEKWRIAQQERERKEFEQRQKERQEQQRREREAREARQREEQRQERMRLTSPEALRDLLDLIRTRYQLDMEIWALKGARRPDRPLVVEKMEKADAVLTEIWTSVESWEVNAGGWTPEEWKLAQEIKERIQAKGKRIWENAPPWNEH